MASLRPVPDGNDLVDHTTPVAGRTIRTLPNSNNQIETSTTQDGHRWHFEFQEATGTYLISNAASGAADLRYWTYVPPAPGSSEGFVRLEVRAENENIQNWVIRRHFTSEGHTGRGYSFTPLSAPDTVLGYNSPNNGRVMGFVASNPAHNVLASQLWAIGGSAR